jgi:nucleoside-diphosphate-sugar epimerase
MSKVLITGGAGFIGSHLCRRLLKDGHEVICIDNFLSGSRDNVSELLSNPNFKLIEFDICRPLDELYKLDELTRLSAIFHFACPASPNPASPVSYMAHPVETMMVSSVGSKNMLDLAVAQGCQIIFASTSEVYGDPLVHPQPETYFGNVNPNGPRSCYDEGKRFMEALAFSYYRKLKAKIKVIRIFNTYGPYMRLDDGRFTINLIDSYLNHKPFKMYGDGSVTRSFCYIDDLVEGIMRIFGKDEMVGEVINLGNPGEFTIKDAIQVFEKIVGSELVKEYEAAQLDDPKLRKPDISKAKRILNWEPTIDFATGMTKTLEYYRHA